MDRLSETFDRFEIDDSEQTQHPIGHDTVDNRQSVRDRMRRSVDQMHRHSQNRCQKHNQNHSLSRSHERGHQSSQHYANNTSKKATSVKDRLGSQLRRHSTSTKARFTEVRRMNSSESTSNNEQQDEMMEDEPVKNGIERNEHDQAECLIAEEPVEFEKLEVILSKSMGKFCALKRTSEEIVGDESASLHEEMVNGPNFIILA